MTAYGFQMKSDDIQLSDRQMNLLNKMQKDMGFHGVWCFYVVQDQDAHSTAGYIPAMVFQDIQKTFPMNGPLYGDMPFVIGQTYEEATIICQLMNDYIGLDQDQVNEILDSAGLQQS